MLTTVRSRIPRLTRLADIPTVLTGEGLDWTTPIDRTCWYFCETLTPLYYTPVYGELTLDQRRRYNQLTALMANEVIALLETELLNASLNAVESAGAHDEELRAAVGRFREDERRHAEIWRRLNSLSEPTWYEAAPRHLVRLPSIAGVLARLVARYPLAFPVVFWLQLMQEERSVDISRRCMRVPVGRIEPRYAAAYAAHLQDEVRHVLIDCYLIERFCGSRSALVRRITARLFRTIVGWLLVTPVRSSGSVVERLAAEHRELQPLLPRMKRELAALAGSDAYHEMMYSRATTPMMFGLFDRFEEFHQMKYVLRAYQPKRALGSGV